MATRVTLSEYRCCKCIAPEIDGEIIIGDFSLDVNIQSIYTKVYVWEWSSFQFICETKLNFLGSLRVLANGPFTRVFHCFNKYRDDSSSPSMCLIVNKFLYPGSCTITHQKTSCNTAGAHYPELPSSILTLWVNPVTYLFIFWSTSHGGFRECFYNAKLNNDKI